MTKPMPNKDADLDPRVQDGVQDADRCPKCGLHKSGHPQCTCGTKNSPKEELLEAQGIPAEADNTSIEQAIANSSIPDPELAALRAVPEFEGLYSITKDGRVYSHISNKFMKPTVVKNGYHIVSLLKMGHYYTTRINRLVLTAYDRPPKPGELACHRDGNKANNHISNLRWGSYQNKDVETPETTSKRSLSQRGLKAHEKNPMWKGDKVGYHALHDWIRNNFGKADHCESETCTGKAKRMEWSNISGEYRRDRADFRMLCVTCHRLFDNARKRAEVEKLKEEI